MKDFFIGNTRSSTRGKDSSASSNEAWIGT